MKTTKFNIGTASVIGGIAAISWCIPVIVLLSNNLTPIDDPTVLKWETGENPKIATTVYENIPGHTYTFTVDISNKVINVCYFEANYTTGSATTTMSVDGGRYSVDGGINWTNFNVEGNVGLISTTPISGSQLMLEISLTNREYYDKTTDFGEYIFSILDPA